MGILKVSIKRYELVVDSLLSVCDLLRTNRPKTYDFIGNLFAVITANETLLSRLNKTPYMGSEFQAEISSFINERVSFIVRSGIDCIRAKINYDPLAHAKSINIGDMELIADNALTGDNLRFVEFEILNICRRASSYLTSTDPGSKLSSTMTYDLKSMLEVLITIFIRLDKSLRVSSSSKYTVFDANGDVTKELVVLGYIIAKVAVAYEYVSNNEAPFLGVKDRQKELVSDDYQRYGTMGAMPFEGIICCFKNVQLLELTVTNPDGRISELDKKCLLDILTLSKLT